MRHILILLLMLPVSVSWAKYPIAVYAAIEPPYVIQEANKIQGFSIELTESLFQESGLMPIWHLSTRQEGLEKVISTPETAVINVLPTKPMSCCYWLGPIVTSTSWKVVTFNQQRSLTLEEIKDYKIAVLLDSEAHIKLKAENFPYFYVVTTLTQAIVKLKRKEIDFIAADSKTLAYYAKTYHLHFKTVFTALEAQNRYLALNKEMPFKIVAKLKAKLLQKQQDGSISVLNNKWLE